MTVQDAKEPSTVIYIIIGYFFSVYPESKKKMTSRTIVFQ